MTLQVLHYKNAVSLRGMAFSVYLPFAKLLINNFKMRLDTRTKE